MAFDKTASTLFSITVPTGVAVGTAYQTIFQSTIPGFIDSFVMSNPNATLLSVRITVDGVVKFEGSSNASSRIVGVTKRSGLRSTGTDANAAIQNPSASNGAFLGLSAVTDIVGFPYTLNAAQATTIAIMADTLFFSSSVLIEAKISTAASVPYYVYGGTA